MGGSSLSDSSELLTIIGSGFADSVFSISSSEEMLGRITRFLLLVVLGGVVASTSSSEEELELELEELELEQLSEVSQLPPF